jgi:hypothetical protein
MINQQTLLLCNSYCEDSSLEQFAIVVVILNLFQDLLEYLQFPFLRQSDVFDKIPERVKDDAMDESFA